VLKISKTGIRFIKLQFQGLYDYLNFKKNAYNLRLLLTVDSRPRMIFYRVIKTNLPIFTAAALLNHVAVQHGIFTYFCHMVMNPENLE
jgi:hypothetical protein